MYFKIAFIIATNILSSCSTHTDEDNININSYLMEANRLAKRWPLQEAISKYSQSVKNSLMI